MSLQLDLFDRENRLAAIPEILEHHVIDDFLPVQNDGHAVADHLNVERIPVAQLVVGHARRLARVLRVVVKTARADLGAYVAARSVPYLHLRRAAQINACVALLPLGVELPVDVHLEITVELLRTDIVEALPDVHEHAVIDLPVAVHRLVGHSLFFASSAGFIFARAIGSSTRPFQPLRSLPLNIDTYPPFLGSEARCLFTASR